MENKTVGSLIRQARKNSKLTQRQLSELTGVSEMSIRNYEANRYKPKTEQIMKLSDALRLPIEEFMKLY